MYILSYESMYCPLDSEAVIESIIMSPCLFICSVKWLTKTKSGIRRRSVSPKINLDSFELKTQGPLRHLALLLVTEAHIATNYKQMVFSALWQANSELEQYLKSKQVQ